HFDGHHPAVVRIDSELDIAAPGLNADFANDPDGGIAHALVFLVGERLRRGHGDAIAGVDSHWVEVLDRANDDDVVRLVAHHFELESLPADNRFLDQHAPHRTEIESAGDQVIELGAIVSNAAAGAAEGKAWAQDAGEPHFVADRLRLRQIV